MADIETQKTTDERPKVAPNAAPPADFEFVRRASELRNALKIPEDQDVNWQGMMRKVQEKVSPWKRKGVEAVDGKLARKYDDLIAKRDTVIKMMNSGLGMLNENRSLSKFSETIPRIVSGYIDEIDVYEHMNEGRVPMGAKLLPQYFAKYVEALQAEELAIGVATKILPIQFDVRDKAGIGKDISPKTIAPLANQILYAAVRFDLKMDVLMDAEGNARTDNATCLSLLDQTRSKEENEKTWPKEVTDASRFLAFYFEKHNAAIRQAASLKGKKPTELSVAEALQACSQGSMLGNLITEAAVQIKNIEAKQIPDMRAFLDEMFEKKEFFTEEMSEIVLAPLATISNEQDRQIFRQDAKAVFEFFRGPGKSFDQTQIEWQIRNFNDARKDMIRAVLRKVTGTETDPKTGETIDNAALLIDKIRKATMIPLAPDDPVNKEAFEKLSALIRDKRLLPKDVFELYYLSESKGSNLLLAFKAVSLLNKYVNPTLAIEFQMKMLEEMDDMAFAKAEDFLGMGVEMGLTHEQQVELENVRSGLQETGIQKIKEIAVGQKAFAERFPLYATLIWGATIVSAASATAGVSYWAWRTQLRFRSDRLSKFGRMDVDAIRKKYGITPDVAPDAQINLAKKAANQLALQFQRMDTIERAWPWEKTRVLSQGAQRIADAATPGLKHQTIVGMIREVQIPSDYPTLESLVEDVSEITGDKEAAKKALVDGGYKPTDVDRAMKNAFVADIPDAKPKPSILAEDAPVAKKQLLGADGQPLNPLQRAQAREGNANIGDALDPARVSQNAAKVSPGVAGKKVAAPDASKPDADAPAKKGWFEEIKARFGKGKGKK